MFTMLLTFCALSGAPCIEVEPAEPPQSMTECLVGGQSAAATINVQYDPMYLAKLGVVVPFDTIAGVATSSE